MLRKQFHTVRTIARQARCSRVQAYRRIAQLRAEGVEMVELRMREHPTGPLAVAFAIVDRVED